MHSLALTGSAALHPRRRVRHPDAHRAVIPLPEQERKPSVGDSLDFVRLTTRVEGARGGASHVRRLAAKRNRINRHLNF